MTASWLTFLVNRIKSKKLFLVYVFIFLFAVSAIRAPSVGVDTNTYLFLFDDLKGMTFSQVMQWGIYYEKGYMLFNLLIQQFTMNSQFLLVITSFIIVGSFSLLIYKYSASMYLSFFLFVTLTFYYSSMNSMRQYVAMSILTFSLKFIFERRLVKFLIVLFIASLFHKTAWMFSVVYLFTFIKFTRKRALIAIVLSFAASFYLTPLIPWFLTITHQYQVDNSYLNSDKFGSILKSLVIFGIFIVGVIVKYYEPNSHKAAADVQLSKSLMKREITTSQENVISWIMLVAFCVYIVSFKMSILGRAAEYFAVYSVIYLPNAVERINSKHNRVFVTLLVMGCSLLYNAVIFIFRPEWFMVTPYSMF